MTAEPTTAPPTPTDGGLSSRRLFVGEQLAALEPLEFVVLAAPRPDGGMAFATVHRSEDGARFTVEAAAAPPLDGGQHAAVTALGFGTDRAPVVLEVPVGTVVFVRELTESVAAADAVEAVLAVGFGVPAGRPVDVQHGSRRDAVERERRMAVLKERLRALLTAAIAPNAFEVDPDGDFTFPYASTRVWVLPRFLPNGALLVRVAAVTNVDIEPTPALGLFLSEANFGLAFGRFSLDRNHRSVWFEDSLWGDSFTDDEFGMLVRIVASTADDFDERIAGTFGGRVFNPPDAAGAAEDAPASKPGTGMGFYL